MTYQRGNYTLVSDEEIPGMPQIRWDPHKAVVALPLYQTGLTCLATVVLDQRSLAQHLLITGACTCCWCIGGFWRPPASRATCGGSSKISLSRSTALGFATGGQPVATRIVYRRTGTDARPFPVWTIALQWPSLTPIFSNLWL